MSSSIDVTKPADRMPAHKADMRANWAAAKSEIEALQAPMVVDSAATQVTVDAASFGLASTVIVLCTSAAPAVIMLAADVPPGRSVMVRKEHPGFSPAIGHAGPGATLTKAASASFSVTQQYQHLVFYVARNDDGASAQWALV